MSPTVNIADLITGEANAQGVPPSIALAVAKVESGVSQWTSTGALVTSSAGAQGVFQLLPSTAAGLGVDPADVNGNIQGGIAYLKQLYNQYGNWSDALAAYNWGPGNVNKAASAGTSIPGQVANYVAAVLGISGSSPAPASSAEALSSSVPGSGDVLASLVPGGASTIALVALGVLGVAAWWLLD